MAAHHPPTAVAAPIASLNYLLTSHAWRQDHNGFSHQDPGSVDHILNKSSEAVRVYLPPDDDTLLSVADHALRSKDYVNVIVAGKQPCYDWLSMEQARVHCARGAGIWDWAGKESGTREPDVVLAYAGDVAAATLVREQVPAPDGWTKTFTDPRLCAAIVDRLTFNGTIIETGTDSCRLASARTRLRNPPSRLSATAADLDVRDEGVEAHRNENRC